LKRSELREKKNMAARSNGVVGNKGTNIPSTPTAVQTKPKKIKKYRFKIVFFRTLQTQPE
jgi:hypothetical protein